MVFDQPRQVRSKSAREGSGTTTPALSAELGWFYAATQRHSSLAVVYAGRAVASDPNSPVYQRIMGAAELIGDQVPCALLPRRVLSVEEVDEDVGVDEDPHDAESSLSWA